MKFTRGYSESRERLKRTAKYSRSCFNCDYYYQSVGDTSEVCQNPNVLKYDMVVTDNNVYCTYWTPSKPDKSKSSRKRGKLFKGQV